MQKYSVLFLLLIFQMNAYSQAFTLTGQIKNNRTDTVFLSYYSSLLGRGVTDSALIKNNKFLLKGQLGMPSLVYIRLHRTKTVDKNTAFVFIEPGNIDLLLDAYNMSEPIVSGSATHKTYDTLKALQNNLHKEYKLYLDSLSVDPNNSVLLAKEQEYQNRLTTLDTTFMLARPKSLVTAFFLGPYFRKMNFEQLNDYYSNMGERLQRSPYGERLQELFKRRFNGRVGEKAFAFIKPGLNNDTVSLKAFRGKYVLLDFWASWCLPCRKESPKLIELYNKYHPKGLEIIGISSDKNSESEWEEAIQKDGTYLWHHVLKGLDLQRAILGKFDPNDIGRQYNVSVLPTKFLIDCEGKIVGRFEDVENISKLEDLLKEIFE